MGKNNLIIGAKFTQEYGSIQYECIVQIARQSKESGYQHDVAIASIANIRSDGRYTVNVLQRDKYQLTDTNNTNN